MAYWLMKSEPDEFSIDDLAAAPDKSTPWFGVRNYQARNYMRDTMRIGDGVLFYHSSCEVPGIYGLAQVSSKPHPDETQFRKKSPYFDPKAKKDDPRWMLVDVKFVRKTRAHVQHEAAQHDSADNALHGALSTREIFVLTSVKEPALFSCSQAGLVNNLNDGLAWGLFPIYFAAAGVSIGRIGILAAIAISSLSWRRGHRSPHSQMTR